MRTNGKESRQRQAADKDQGGHSIPKQTTRDLSRVVYFWDGEVTGHGVISLGQHEGSRNERFDLFRRPDRDPIQTLDRTKTHSHNIYARSDEGEVWLREE